jgi:hypothetical protein
MPYPGTAQPSSASEYVPWRAFEQTVNHILGLVQEDRRARAAEFDRLLQLIDHERDAKIELVERLHQAIAAESRARQEELDGLRRAIEAERETRMESIHELREEQQERISGELRDQLLAKRGLRYSIYGGIVLLTAGQLVELARSILA